MADRGTLVLGATGKTGSRVLAGLRQRGERVRAGARSGSPRFDWHDPDGWGAVLDGMRAVYVCSPVTAAVRAGERGRTVGFGAAEVSRFVGAAVGAGVERIVLLAGRSGRDGSPYMLALEEPVRNSGVEWTILSPGVFQQNYVEEPLRGAVAAGEVRQLATGDAGLDFVHVADIADVAVEVLTGSGHGGETYELSGPRAFPAREAVAIIGRTLGRAVAHVEIDPDAWAERARADGLTEESIDFALTANRGQAGGAYAEPFDGVRRVLGREPRSFEAFVREAAATGAWG